MTAFTRSFRLVCPAPVVPLVEGLLKDQGFDFAEEPFSPLCRRLVHEPFPLGTSLAAVFGYIYIQDRSSMLPPLVLQPHAGEAVLDMCASPGSKTGMLAQMTGPAGFVLGNEPSAARLATLRRNMSHLNLLSCATMSFPGQALPLPGAESPADGAAPYPGWSAILLDPPCSGWGTAERHPQVMELWQGDKVLPLIRLQRELLREAFRLARPGGRVVYSTCTTNTAENEDQLAYAVEHLGFRLLPVTPPAGFSFQPSLRAGIDACLRVATGTDGQGFFVGLLEKPHSARPEDEACAPRERTKEKNFRSRGETRGRTRSSGGRQAEYLSREAVEGEFVEADLLPPGRVGIFGNTACFLPEAAERLVPLAGGWKGFPLGRLSGGRLKVNAFLRCLMPSPERAREMGRVCIDLEEVSPLAGLIAGRGLGVEKSKGEIGLYYRGLPLCRLTAKNGRALLPALP